ncbi:MAG: minor capsid protein, partial [Deltaproteobacteria bacterium]|nr:minor capsid protein [Deltaproteobacteria bacterium]
FDSPFSDAVKYAQLKGFALSPDGWRDLWRSAHAHAFTVARVTTMDVVQVIKGYVDQALADGTTVRQFQKDLIPCLRQAGWWAESEEQAKITLPGGEVRKRLTMSRLGTIYDTNINVATAVGRWKQFQDTATTRPYVEYDGVDDGRTRPAHRALHGKVFRLDDPGLATIAPPNGFRCRCFLSSLTDREVQARGLKIDDAGKYAGAPDDGWDFNPGAAGFEAWKPYLPKYSPELAQEYQTHKISLWEQAKERLGIGRQPKPETIDNEPKTTSVIKSATPTEMESKAISPRIAAKIKKLEEKIKQQYNLSEVNLGNNPYIAEYISSNWPKAARMGYDLPQKLIVRTWLQAFGQISDALAKYDNHDDAILINPMYDWLNIYLNLANYYKKNNLSTTNPAHVLIHELAHKRHFDELGLDRFNQVKQMMPTNDERMKLANHAGNIAALSSLEAVAEIHTGIMCGKRYPQEIMSIYQKFLGPTFPRPRGTI